MGEQYCIRLKAVWRACNVLNWHFHLQKIRTQAILDWVGDGGSTTTMVRIVATYRHQSQIFFAFMRVARRRFVCLAVQFMVLSPR